MSKSSAQEKKRQESNAKNRRLATQYQDQANQLQSTFNSRQEELDRLKSARSSLKSAISSYKDVKTNLKSTFQDNLDTSNFKGTIKTGFDNNITTIISDTTSDIQIHSSNLATLGQEITNRQMSLDLLGSQITSLNQAASNCLAAIY
ncbi:MAG: hypothetical protein Q4E30_03200 [Streptococcus gallolyticus]|nr:hypothetical protein [Streptococcus gallolyticus]